MSDDLSPKERAILLTLLLHGPTLSNSKQAAFRLRVAPRERERLNAFGLVTSVKKAAYQHRLTDAGRQWCLKELASGRARAANSPLERAFYSLLMAVRANVDLPSLLGIGPHKPATPLSNPAPRTEPTPPRQPAPSSSPAMLKQPAPSSPPLDAAPAATAAPGRKAAPGVKALPGKKIAPGMRAAPGEEALAGAEAGARASGAQTSWAELAVQAAYRKLRDSRRGGVSLAALLDATRPS